MAPQAGSCAVAVPQPIGTTTDSRHPRPGAAPPCKIGDPAPADETTCTLVARDTATQYMYEFQSTDVGKTAYWFIRWVNHANQHGPLSGLVSAKINP